MDDLKICKQLKEAGFPDLGIDDPRLAGRPYKPSIEELLDELGERFMSLSRAGDDFSLADKGQWMAFSMRHAEDTTVADTPWQALALLWLEVNKTNGA
jgi:hypothetical protein